MANYWRPGTSAGCYATEEDDTEKELSWYVTFSENLPCIFLFYISTCFSIVDKQKKRG